MPQYSARDPYLEEKLAPLNALTWPEVARQTLVAFLLARTHAALAAIGSHHDDPDGPSQSSAVVAATSVATALGSVRLALTGPRAKHGPVSGPSRDKATLNLASYRLLARYEPPGSVNHPVVVTNDENSMGSGNDSSTGSSSSGSGSSGILARRAAAEKWLQEGFHLLAHSRSSKSGAGSTPALVPSSSTELLPHTPTVTASSDGVATASALGVDATSVAVLESAPEAAVSMEEDSELSPVLSSDSTAEASTTTPPVDGLVSNDNEKADAQNSEGKPVGNEGGNVDEEEEEEDEEEDDDEDDEDVGSGDGSRADSGWVSRRLQKISDDANEPYVRRAIARVLKRLLTTRSAQPLLKFPAPALAQALCEDLGMTSSLAGAAASAEDDVLDEGGGATEVEESGELGECGKAGGDLACLNLLIGPDEAWGMAPLARAFVVASPVVTATTAGAIAGTVMSRPSSSASSTPLSTLSAKEQTAAHLAARYGKGVEARQMAAALAADVRAMLRAARAWSLGGGSGEPWADLWTAADRVSPIFER